MPQAARPPAGPRRSRATSPSSAEPETPPDERAAGDEPPPAERATRPGIFVATPAYGASCYMPYVSGVLSLQRACAEAGVGFEHFWLGGTALLHEQRNVAVARFLYHSDLSHLLFVDADVGFDGLDVLRMLLAEQEVVLGPYPAKHINWEAVAHAARTFPDRPAAELALAGADYTTNFYGLEGQNHLPHDQLCEIHAGGAGLMLLARSVFARLDAAYPAALGRFPDAYRGLVPGIDTLSQHFEFLSEPDGRLLSEDIAFCRKWRGAGGRLFAATWMRTVHAGPYLFQGDLPRLTGGGG